eukprot:m.259238 g.259238  ORF g.259238 m.259238 type:complete len:1155 (-) comp19203_c0_seq3:429-3893(-)
MAETAKLGRRRAVPASSPGAPAVVNGGTAVNGNHEAWGSAPRSPAFTRRPAAQSGNNSRKRERGGDEPVPGPMQRSPRQRKHGSTEPTRPPVKHPRANSDHTTAAPTDTSSCTNESTTRPTTTAAAALKPNGSNRGEPAQEATAGSRALAKATSAPNHSLERQAVNGTAAAAAVTAAVGAATTTAAVALSSSQQLAEDVTSSPPATPASDSTIRAAVAADDDTSTTPRRSSRSRRPSARQSSPSPPPTPSSRRSPPKGMQLVGESATPKVTNALVAWAHTVTEVTDVSGNKVLLDLAQRLPVHAPEPPVPVDGSDIADSATDGAADGGAADGAADTAIAVDGQSNTSTGGKGGAQRGRGRGGRGVARGRGRRRKSWFTQKRKSQWSTCAVAFVDETPPEEEDTQAMPQEPPPTPVFRTLPDDEVVRTRFPSPSGPYFLLATQQQDARVTIVEYDVDDEDEAWLRLINKRRAKEGMSKVTEVQFEALMDKLEKESYFETGQDLESLAARQTDEDAVCAVCLSGDGENSNLILFCDACDLAVHQECYGVPYIPEGQWLCRRCLHSPSTTPPCELCPNMGGALKQTSKQKWVHVVCAMYVPEVQFDNAVFLEPVTGVKHVPQERIRLTCYLCGLKSKGACVQCYKPTCYQAFHASCAQRYGLCMMERPDERQGGQVTRQVYCHQHTPKDVDCSSLVGLSSKARKKMAPHLEKLYQCREDAPKVSVPLVDIDRIEVVVRALGIEGHGQFVKQIHDYWTLKRQSRHGVPLLRRLQASHVSRTTHVDSSMEQKRFFKLRQGLEKARMLVGQTLRRERLKAELAESSFKLFMLQVCPLREIFAKTLTTLERKDTEKVFQEPINTQTYVDYLDFVDEPLDFPKLREKAELGAYMSASMFVHDVQAMCENCMLYNKQDSWWFDYAQRYLSVANVVLESAVRHIASLGFDVKTGATLDPLPPKEIWSAAGVDLVFKFGQSVSGKEQSVRAKLVKASAIAHPGSRTQRVLVAAQELAEMREPANKIRRLRRRAAARVAAARRLGTASSNEAGHEHTHLAFVWAKCSGFAWFPALVVDPDEEGPLTLTEGVLTSRPDGQAHLCMFFEKKHRWAWLPGNKLRSMLDNPEEDRAMINRSKKGTQRAQVLDAYERARAFEAAGLLQDEA